MKKTIAVLGVLVCLLFTACGDKASQAPSASAPPPENGAAAPSAPGESAVLLGSMYGINSTTAASEGAFVCRSRPDLTSNLTYIDYATQTHLYLCNQPNCSHDSAACPSYFDAFAVNLFLSADQQTLYAMEYAMPDRSPVGVLWSMQPNGANRTKVLSLASGESFTDTVAARGSKLYVTVMTPNNVKELREIDTATGSVEVLTKFPSTSWVFGAFEDNLVLLHLKSDRFRYETLSLSTKETNTFYEYDYSDAGDGAMGRCYGDMLYILKSTGNGVAQVIKHSIKTGEETVLTSELPFFNVDTTHVKGFYDNYMLVSVTNTTDPENITTGLYSVALDTGAVTQLQHNITNGMMEQPTSILGQTETDYLILSNPEMKTVTLYSNDGTPYESEVEMETYCLISKSDFWANAQTGRPIQNTL